MATFNYPFTVASNEPMPSFGILDRSGTPIQNPFRGFANLFDADPNTPGVQIFNTNPNRNELRSLQTSGGLRSMPFSTELCRPEINAFLHRSHT